MAASRSGTFIKRLPTGSGTADVRFREADYHHAAAWDRQIQAPFIKSSGRIDSSWNWATLYLRSVILEIAAGRSLAYLQLVTPTRDGEAFPIGQLLLADGFPYPPDEDKPCAFLWYLAGTPEAAVRAAGAQPCKAVFAALVDAAIQFSYMSGYEGRICLHASPAGSSAQQRDLLERYERLKLQRWGGRGLIGWFRRNDGRYFYADERTAMLLASRLDHLR